jgi:hypothetical protein
VQLAIKLGDALCDLPLPQVVAVLEAIVFGVETARGEGIGTIAGAPTRAELEASWAALEPEQDAAERARHDFAKLWNALTDDDRRAFVASLRRAA